MESDNSQGRNRFKQALQYAGMSFMTHTSSHGAKYICEDDRKLFERIFWVIMISVGVGTSAYMVSNLYERYTTHTTVNILAETHYPTWKIPFPAVTICNNNRVLKSRAEELIENLTYHRVTDADALLLDMKSLAKLHFPDIEIGSDLGGFQDLLDFNSMTVEDAMLRVSQPCEEMLERCSWQSEIVQCTDLFKMQKSHLGFCCSFNYIPPLANGSTDAEAKPIHTRLQGPRMGLSLLINPAVDDYYVNAFLSSGVSVHVHEPYVYPDDHIIMKLVPVNKEVLIPIRMTQKMCSEDAANLDPDARDCLLPHERNLKYFGKYLDDNCITECRMKHFLEYCACIPYYFPLHDHQKVCDIMDSTCLLSRFELLHSFKPGNDLSEIVIPHHEKYSINAVNEDAMMCDCPTQCEGVTFDTRVSWGDFSGSSMSINQLFGPDTNDTNRTLLHVFLESNFSQVTKKEVVTTKSVLLGLLGGICSLFLGCSFVTPIEFSYFFTVRLGSFFKDDKSVGNSCPASPQRLRNPRPSSDPPEMSNRFPSVRTQNLNINFINIRPSDMIIGYKK